MSARRKALLAALMWVDREAGIMNGVPGNPVDTIADVDDIAINLSDAFAVPFDQNWPEAVIGVMTQVGDFPDIGPDPMKGDRVDRIEQSIAVCREAYVKQQKGVPDQTALVWRWHLGALLECATRLKALLSRDEKQDRADAERWRALMSSDRIRMMGCAGFDFAEDGTATVRDEYQHMGVEVWNKHPAGGDACDTRGRKVLLAYVDARRGASKL